MISDTETSINLMVSPITFQTRQQMFNGEFKLLLQGKTQQMPLGLPFSPLVTCCFTARKFSHYLIGVRQVVII